MNRHLNVVVREAQLCGLIEEGLVHDPGVPMH